MPTLPEFWSLLQSPGPTLVGWTLLHFVWQGALMAALLAGVLHLLRRYPPQVRYAASSAALLGLLLLPIGTGLLLSERNGSVERESPSATITEMEAPPVLPAVRSAPADRTPTLSSVEQVALWLRPAVPWIVFAWGAGVVVFSVRLAVGAWHVRRFRRHSADAPPEWRARLQRLAGRFGLRDWVTLRASAQVDSPMVVGWWRPVILVPVGLLSGMPPDEVEALLLHELAHVRRHDVLVGRLQAVVEVVLFFHPATWWISSQVRRSREACCDDLAVARGANRTEYARALAALAEMAVGQSTRPWAPAAGGGPLLHRIRRLLSPARPPSSPVQRLSMGAAVLAVTALFIGLAACASQQSTTGDSTDAARAATTDTPAPEHEEREREGDAREKNAHERKTQIVIRTDSTERILSGPPDAPHSPDSLHEDVFVFRSGEPVDTVDVSPLDQIRPPVPPDSFGRRFRGWFHPDSLEHELDIRIDADSLERVLRARVRVDSLDSMLRSRFPPDSLEQRALQIHMRADSLARWHREHADSLRVRFERMRQRMERELPEHLREEARRLREEARELEERAEEMETPEAPVPPDSTGSEG